MLEQGIDGNQSLRATPEQHLTVLFNQILAMPVMRGEIEVSGIHQMVADPAQYLRVIAISKFGN